MNTNQLMQMLNQLQSNPTSILSKIGIPQNISNNPNEVIQYMMKNGKITQNQYDNAVKQANNLKSMFGMKS